MPETNVFFLKGEDLFGVLRFRLLCQQKNEDGIVCAEDGSVYPVNRFGNYVDKYSPIEDEFHKLLCDLVKGAIDKHRKEKDGN